MKLYFYINIKFDCHIKSIVRIDKFIMTAFA